MERDPVKEPIRCAAVDMGASSGRVMLAILTDGHIALSEVHRFPTPRGMDPDTGLECWDIDAIVGHVRDGLRKAADLGPIHSVGCDTWGVDFVLLDAQGRRVAPMVCYRDHRTDGEMERVFAHMSEDEIYRRTGHAAQAYNSLYQLSATARQHPDWLARTRHVLFTPDYLHFALSGVFSNERTIASTAQLVNLHTGTWDADLLGLAGLSSAVMHPLVEAGTVLGPLIDSPWGADAGVQVIAPGGHDTASAVAGAPLEGPNEAYISSGTWSLMGIESPIPIISPQAVHWGIGNEGATGGGHRVLKNIMGLWLIQRIREELGSPSFDTMIQAAAVMPAWTSLINTDDPALLNPDSMVATIRAMTAHSGQPVPADLGALTRCVFDSLALNYAQVKCQLETLSGRTLTRVRIIGGGSRNALLNQVTADACGCPVSAGPVETSALGNALTQMVALGEVGSLAEARAVTRTSFDLQEFSPRAAVPAEVWARYRSLRQVLQPA